jgi:hypothetical protein
MEEAIMKTEESKSRMATTPLPTTISGLWALHPLTPLKSAKAYDAAADLSARLAVRRLNAVQKEYFRELTELVEAYEESHNVLESTERQLRALAASST